MENTKTYNTDPHRPRPYVVVDDFDECGREGVYSGSYEDCENFIAAQGGMTYGMRIVLNWR